jgi:putative colanic acid biosysnthesis UDP-glucose lipid carrier transferase
MGGSLSASPIQKRVGFGTVEPGIIFLSRQLEPLAAVATFALIGFLCHQSFTPSLGVVAALAYLITGRIYGWPHRDEQLIGKSVSSIFSRIVIEWLAVVALLLLIGFSLKVTADFSREMILSWFAVTPLSLGGVHALRQKVRWFVSNTYAPRFVIIGANSVGHEVLRRLPGKGFLGFFDFRGAERLPSSIQPEQLIGHCKDVAEFARINGVNAIYIALPLSNVPRIVEMIRELRDTTVSVYFVPDVFSFDLVRGRLVEINGIPAISVCDTPFHGRDAVAKRVTDLVLAGLALLVLSPLMLAIAAGVKLSSPGPALFRQRRYGLHGEEISVYKFRSMTVCEDGAVVTQATRQDQRVTPIGRILRSTSLDELPQLLNVLEGKMSLVGPRPHAVAHNEMYRKLISGYMIRHKVRPGITGLAQVNGLRGETETVEKMRARVQLDLEYLSHWSPWLDIKIICKTMWVVARDRNVY